MIIRKSILPRCVQDACVTAFLLIMIPVVYYFELFVVLPTYYEIGSKWYICHFVAGTFILWNICANMIAVMMCDTSIRGRLMPSLVDGANSSWNFCATCESIVPPRSWHCNICNVCILRRDHHCIFTSCCIGHHNQRYFIAFVFYMFIATLYASYHNTFFISQHLEFDSWKSVLKVFFPLLVLFLDFSIKHLILFLYLIILIGCSFVGVLLYYHMNLILRGVTTHESRELLSKYDQGRKQNLVDALGERWYLIWISPFVKSKLPRDGIHWDIKQSVKAK